MLPPDAQDRILRHLEASDARGFDLRLQAMEALSQLPGYHWSGIYRLQSGELVLDAFVGQPTEHTRIAIGKGVCGTAIAKGQNQVIRDVRELDNYLSCSLETRSEIVVLIRDANGEILGQIDIDGHDVGAFDSQDEAFLEKMAALLAERWS